MVALDGGLVGRMSKYQHKEKGQLPVDYVNNKLHQDVHGTYEAVPGSDVVFINLNLRGLHGRGLGMEQANSGRFGCLLSTDTIL